MYHVSHILVKNPLGKDFPDFLIPIMISPSKGFNFFFVNKFQYAIYNELRSAGYSTVSFNALMNFTVNTFDYSES